MADSRAKAKKAQFEPQTPCNTKQGSALKMVEKLKKTKRQAEETPNRSTEENWNIIINNSSNT